MSHSFYKKAAFLIALLFLGLYLYEIIAGFYEAYISPPTWNLNRSTGTLPLDLSPFSYKNWLQAPSIMRTGNFSAAASSRFLEGKAFRYGDLLFFYFPLLVFAVLFGMRLKGKFPLLLAFIFIAAYNLQHFLVQIGMAKFIYRDFLPSSWGMVSELAYLPAIIYAGYFLLAGFGIISLLKLQPDKISFPKP